MQQYDMLNQEIQHSQNYTLMAFMPFAFVGSHLAFAATTKTKISYPQSQTEAASQLAKHENLLASLVTEMTPAARAFCTAKVLVNQASSND